MNVMHLIRGHKNNKKGFTLVEVIVVLVIIAILIAIAVPSVMKYIDDANDIKDDVSVSYLNKATEGYRVRLYADGKLGDDVFSGITTDKARQEKLLEVEWIDELKTSIYDDTNYFHWNIEKQKWERKDSGSSPNPDEPSKPDNTEPDLSQTILGPLYDENKKYIGDAVKEWVSGTQYKVGDVVKRGDKYYKCILNNPLNYSPDHSFVVSYWKNLELEFNKRFTYELGDIVEWNGDYYLAIKPENHETFSPSDYSTYVSNKFHPIDDTNESAILSDANIFKKVEWSPTEKKFI